jgi:hypothetical protein
MTLSSITPLTLECRYAACRYAERHIFIVVLGAIMLSVVMLIVVAPTEGQYYKTFFTSTLV